MHIDVDVFPSPIALYLTLEKTARIIRSIVWVARRERERTKGLSVHRPALFFSPCGSLVPEPIVNRQLPPSHFPSQSHEKSYIKWLNLGPDLYPTTMSTECEQTHTYMSIWNKSQPLDHVFKPIKRACIVMDLGYSQGEKLSWPLVHSVAKEEERLLPTVTIDTLKSHF